VIDVAATRELVLDIEGMTCASCVQKVERALGGVDGVDAAAVNLATRTATVRGEVPGVDPLIVAVSRAGYGARPHDDARDPGEEERSYRRRLAVAAPLTLLVLALTFLVPDRAAAPLVAWAVATPIVFWAGWPFFSNAARAARHRTTTMDTLVALGALAAYLYSAWLVADAALGTGGAEMGHYFDTAAVIITLILVGKTLEARARASAGDASRALLARAATHATVLVDGEERTIPVDDLRPGMVAVVRPGEKIPADGVVRAGTSWVDLSLLTGESVPVDVAPGDDVIGASINGTGRLVVFVTKVGGNTKLAEIVRLLQAAQGSKAPVQRLADRISSVFVPAVLVLAAATFVGWIVVGGGASAGTALLHATAVLLIAGPCALGLATPAAIMAGTGRAAELGVLWKGGAALEAAHDADVVLFDKTGTITEGSMTLADVAGANGVGDDEALALAAAVEAGSEHPIARAVVAAANERSIEGPVAGAHAAEPGAGAVAVIDDARVRVGRPTGLPPAMQAKADEAARRGWTCFGLWRDDVAIGLVSVTDTVKPGAEAAVERLRAMGLDVAMVTGDRRQAAEAVAGRVGIATVHAEVFPKDKVDVVRTAEAEGHRVVFVGDGLNDAPALAAATVGVAMGSGTDVALAAADVQVLGSSIEAVPEALRLARATYRVIRQNLFWAFAYNVVMIPLAVVGVLTPMWAAAAMALSSVTVVANALRLRGFATARTP
jgi:heavy metal translocating P-type ATPase